MASVTNDNTLRLIFRFIFNVCVYFACMYVCNVHAAVHGSQNRVLDLLGMDLQTVVSHHADA